MADFTVYFNPGCSKCRNALALLDEHDAAPRVIEYLKTPPIVAELRDILAKLGIRPLQLVRKSEEIYKTKYAGKTLTDEQWIEAMVADPILIERPIVVRGDRAVIGRPPENVLALLNK